MLTLARDNLRFARANARWIGCGFLLTLFSSFGQTFYIGLSGTALRETFHLSGGDFGLIFMLATLASAASLTFLGRTLDVMPAVKVARFSILLLAFACILMATSTHVGVMVFALYLLRLFGQGMMTEIAFTEVGRWFSAERGRAMALIMQGLQVGAGALPVVFVLLDGWVGWRATWAAAAAVLLLAGYPSILWSLRVERRPSTLEPHAARPAVRDWTRAQVIRDPILYLLLVGMLAPPFIATTIFFHQGYLIALRGYDPLLFAASYSLMSIVTVAFALVSGHLIDRRGALGVLPFFLLPLALALLVMGLVSAPWGLYAFMLLLGIANGLTATLIGAIWPEVYGVANLGGIRAITVSAMVIATALGPGITGELIDQGISLPKQFVWMSVWCALGCLALGLAARSVKRREAAALPAGALQSL